MPRITTPPAHSYVRDRAFVVRINAQEYAALDTLARYYQLSKTDVVRRLIHSAYQKITKTPKKHRKG